MTTILDAGLYLVLGLMVLAPIALIALLRAAFEPRAHTSITIQRPYQPGDVVNGHILMADSNGWRWVALGGDQ